LDLYEVPIIVKSWRPKVEWLLSGSGEKRKWGVFVQWVSVLQDEKEWWK
jgi:hypothetical protein